MQRLPTTAVRSPRSLSAPASPTPSRCGPSSSCISTAAPSKDCEINAAKRWLDNNYHFIFVCKPDSHKHPYQWVQLLESGADIHIVEMRVKNKNNRWEQHTYRYANNVPMVEGQGVLKVNWSEGTITSKGKQTYHNAFITDWEITDNNVVGIVAAGRTRWKIQNENNNLKNRGYHMKHNYRPGGGGHVSSSKNRLELA